MPCHYPARAYRLGDRDNRPGGIVFDIKTGDNVLQELKVPCGKCLGCKQKRVREWALRCQHEARMWKWNYFITLTYDEKHLPDDGSLCYSDFQAFMKKVRHWTGVFDWRNKKQIDSTKVRFFMCGEYGALKRPHYHVLLFNFPIPDLEILRTSKKGSTLYTSKLVSELWNNRGYVTIGFVEYASAAYVAQYCIKKMNEKDLEIMDLETGEVKQKAKEMVQMSRAPGIGATWYEKYQKQVFPIDRCIANGAEVPVPRYYQRKYKEQEPENYEQVIEKRAAYSKARMADNTEERLLVKERCLKAKYEFYGGNR